MQKIMALGFLVLSVLIGSAMVVVGTSTEVEATVWTGMLIIALGIINLAIKLVFPEQKKFEAKKIAKKRPKKAKKKRKSR
ncbi:MAG: hypothetical protein PHU12_02230 [Candidatus Aenigmarchaeota archaeon]|nr:hypothetical protein [Candidatus Aenigmarchaeota archaeon]